MDRVGFATGYDPDASVTEMTEWVSAAEAHGFEMGFFSETVNLNRDGVSAVAAFGLETTDIDLGFTQVVRLRSPVIMAQTIATLDELTDGRMILAPGACTTPQATTHGLEVVDPPGTLTEWVEVMQGLLAGEPVTYEGTHVQLDDVGLGWEPRRAEVPFWIAATSRTGLELAAGLGDGVLLNAGTSPAYSANAVKILREAVAETGRSWDEFTVAQLINCSIEDELSAAIEEIRWEIATKFRPPFHQFGMRKRVGEPVLDESVLPTLESAYESNGDLGLAEALPPSWVREMTASGPSDEAIERVRKYVAAGVDLPILRPATTHQTHDLLETFST